MTAVEGRVVQAGGEEAARTADLHTLSVLVVLVVVGQRLALPVGEQVVPLPLVAGWAGAAWLLWRGVLGIDRLRLELFVVAGSACAAATYAGLHVDDGSSVQPSLPSLLLLVVIYSLWVLRVRGLPVDAPTRVLRTFVATMTVLSVAAVLQMAGQYSGAWSYRDYLGDLVPEAFLLQDYNTDAPVAYASSVYRGNAFVFLEPSFLSQYAALALLAALLLRAPVWQLAVLAAGLLSAVSGTGFLLLGSGLVVLLVRDHRAFRPEYVATGVVALLALLATPFAPQLLDRVGEFGSSGSSASLRFVQPYTESVRGLQEEPVRLYLGAGPGTSERLLTTDRGGGLGDAVTYTVVPKLAFEYGLVAGGLFLLFLAVALFAGPVLPAVPTALLVTTWALSGALLQPHTAVLTWLLVVVFVVSGGGRRGVAPP